MTKIKICLLAAAPVFLITPAIAADTLGYAKSSLHLDEAWQITQGAQSTIIAVIDTGTDVEHPALVDHIWVNSGEIGTDSMGHRKESNGVDDDGNGFIDDVHGWNFANHTHDVRDRSGHGTHIAGIIAGVAPRAQIMVLKYYDPATAPSAEPTSTANAIRYAVKMGAKIINYSSGGPGRDAAEESAIREAVSMGVLVVAAAGNEKANSDRQRFYPADYEIPGLLSVTAVDARGRILNSSNYGRLTVDVAAPGDNILSTLPGGGYGRMSGTSQATAFASGVAALLLAARPGLTDPAAIALQLGLSGTNDPRLLGKTRFQARLNAGRALHDERNLASD